MNTRRHFLKRIAAAAVGTAAATALDPELLAWVPGQKTFFDLALPQLSGTEILRRQHGLSVRMMKSWDFDVNFSPARLDVLYGWSAFRPALACRVAADTRDCGLDVLEGVIITNSIEAEGHDEEALQKMRSDLSGSIQMSGKGISMTMDPLREHRNPESISYRKFLESLSPRAIALSMPNMDVK